MPLSQMSDKVFGMIKSDMYAIKLQEKVRELSVLDTTNRQIRVICLTVAMPLSQMFDKVFGMIKSDMYVIKLQEKEGELSVLDTTNRQIRVICLRRKIFHCF